MDLDGINPRKAKEHPDAIPGSRPLPVSPARKLPKSIQTRHKPRRPPPSDKGTHGSEIVYSSVMAITFRNPHGPPMALAKKKKRLELRGSHMSVVRVMVFQVLSEYRAAGS
jgi:hypothetical protein